MCRARKLPLMIQNRATQEEIRVLKAKVVALMEAENNTSDIVENNPAKMFSALSSTLEHIAANYINGPVDKTLFTTSPRSTTDNGTNMTFFRNDLNLTNARKHVRALTTAK